MLFSIDQHVVKGTYPFVGAVFIKIIPGWSFFLDQPVGMFSRSPNWDDIAFDAIDIMVVGPVGLQDCRLDQSVGGITWWHQMIAMVDTSRNPKLPNLWESHGKAFRLENNAHFLTIPAQHCCMNSSFLVASLTQSL